MSGIKSFVYECPLCASEFYSRNRILTPVICQRGECSREMVLVYEPEPIDRSHPLSLKNFEARSRTSQN